MTPAAGSFLWLLMHDVRLNWRGLTGMFDGMRHRTVVVSLSIGVAVLHAMAWPAVTWLGPYLHTSTPNLPALWVVVGGLTAWMVAQGVFIATRTLFDRADLDLLLGSPMPVWMVMAAKTLAIAASSLGSIAIFAAPVANTGALIEGPVWLAIYPVLAALALVATSAGSLIAMALFTAAGPLRARLYAHIVGTTLGGSFVLGAQIYAVTPVPVRRAAAAWFAKAGLLPTTSLSGPLSLPLQALRGDPVAAGLLLAIACAIFAATVGLTGERFAASVVAAAGAPSPEAEAGHGAAVFRTGHGRNLRIKEWRLMLRDPSFFAQLGLQIIYTIPITVVLLRSHIVPAAFALVPTLVMIAGQVAGSISWITVSGEDAPELIASAPISPAAVDRIKLGAVALPVAVILALPLAGLASTSYYLAIVALVFAAGAATSTSLLNFWHPMPGNRRGMLRRHSQSKLIGLVEHGLAMLWAFAAVFAVVSLPLAMVPLGIIAAILAFVWARHHSGRPRAV